MSEGPRESRAEQATRRLPRPLSLSLAGEPLREELIARIEASGLPSRVGHGVVLASLLAAGRLRQFAAALDLALDSGIPLPWLGESILQSYLFVGFPRTWQAFKALTEARARRGETEHLTVEVPDLKALLEEEHSPDGHPAHDQLLSWWTRGEALCREIYGKQYDRLRTNLGGYHPELADWMILEGYGKVLSRPAIPAGEREQWILPILVVQEAGDQLHSHLRGALRVGVKPADLEATMRLAGVASPRRAARTALARLHQLTTDR